MYDKKIEQVRYIVEPQDTLGLTSVLRSVGLGRIHVGKILAYLMGDGVSGIGFYEAFTMACATANPNEVIVTDTIAEIMVDSFHALESSIDGTVLPQHQVALVHNAIVAYLTELFDNIQTIIRGQVVEIKYLKTNTNGTIWLEVFYDNKNR